jgi:hypothetical protein
MSLGKMFLSAALLGLIETSSASAQCTCLANKVPHGLSLSALIRGNKVNEVVFTLRKGNKVTRISTKEQWSWVTREGEENPKKGGYCLSDYISCPAECPRLKAWTDPDVPIPL